MLRLVARFVHGMESEAHGSSKIPMKGRVSLRFLFAVVRESRDESVEPWRQGV